jgi:hypothetical protein
VVAAVTLPAMLGSARKILIQPVVEGMMTWAAHVSGAHHRQRMTLSRPAGTAGRMHIGERAGVVGLAPAEAPWPARPRDQRA